jgi:CDP-glucose 4,6-dehydratase
MDNNFKFWNNKKCIVTGGMGFGGSHLVEQLVKKGAVIYVLDRLVPQNSYLVLSGMVDKIQYINGDIRDTNLIRMLLENYKIDYIFHLAAQPDVPLSNAMPYETLSINVMGTYSVLEAVRCCSVPPVLIFASSGAYYGTTTQSALIKENQAPNIATNIYAPSKIAGDFAVRCYVRTYGIKAGLCRFINTYGPGNTNFGTIVPRAITLLIEGMPYDFGDRDDGSSVFDYLHIDDMTRGYIAVAQNIERINGEAFNFSGGQAISVRELVKMISRLYDGKEREPVFHGVRREVPVSKLLDCSRAEQILGWHPSLILEQGLTQTIRWYKQFWPKLTMKAENGY